MSRYRLTVTVAVDGTDLTDAYLNAQALLGFGFHTRQIAYWCHGTPSDTSIMFNLPEISDSSIDFSCLPGEGDW